MSVLNESSVGQFHYDNYGLCQTILCIIQIPLLMTGRRKWGSAMVVVAVLLCTVNRGTREVQRNVSLQMEGIERVTMDNKMICPQEFKGCPVPVGGSPLI